MKRIKNNLNQEKAQIHEDIACLKKEYNECYAQDRFSSCLNIKRMIEACERELKALDA